MARLMYCANTASIELHPGFDLLNLAAFYALIFPDPTAMKAAWPVCSLHLTSPSRNPAVVGAAWDKA